MKEKTKKELSTQTGPNLHIMPKKINEPFVLTIFGASGNLAEIKLFPMLYKLAEKELLPKNFYIIGFSRSDYSQKEFREYVKKSIKNHIDDKINNKTLSLLVKKFHYVQGKYSKKDDFKKWKNYIKENVKNIEKLVQIAYFAVPPKVFKDIMKNIGETKSSKKEDIRLVLEKPFGDDASSASDLFHFVSQYFDEKNIYLLDHYLGKSVVQSILTLRESNRILNLIMKGSEVANIQITAFEKVGVEERIGYFERTGTLKDMIQSHLLQVLALITMSIPVSDRPESLHRERYSILNALTFKKSKDNIVLGQYENYTNHKNVPKDSKTNTFAAIKLLIDRQSWYRVPIYIRTGKRLHEKHTYIVIDLKKFAFQKQEEPCNRVIIEFFPEEKLQIKLVNKIGQTTKYQDVITSDTIACKEESCLPEHGLLLLDIIKGEKRYFLSFPEVIATWELIDSVVKFSKRKKVRVEKYKGGSKGPKSQAKITENDNFKWFDIHN
jgi:glucose-6-phosphate 1-dehydrogenase